MGAVRSRLRRWHVWLGWLVGLPMLFWTVSGLVMVAKPIEEVRGEHLIAAPKPINLSGPLVAPRIEGRPVTRSRSSRAPTGRAGKSTSPTARSGWPIR